MYPTHTNFKIFYMLIHRTKRNNFLIIALHILELNMKISSNVHKQVERMLGNKLGNTGSSHANFKKLE